MDFPIQKFQTVDEIQDVINKLQAARDALVRREQEGSAPLDAGKQPELGREKNLGNVENLIDEEYVDEFINVSQVLDDNEESQWLVKTTATLTRSDSELELDRSYVNLAMLNVQNTLVYRVKSLTFEHNTKKKIQQSEALQLNLNTTTVLPNHVHPPAFNTYRKPSPAKLSVRSNGFESPEKAESRNEVVMSSPLSTRLVKPDLSELDDLIIEPEKNLNRANYIETPPRQIDTRTYTRPKKTRMSLEGPLKGQSGVYNTLTLRKEKPDVMSLDETFEFPMNQNNNLNETFVQQEKLNGTFTRSKMELEDEDHNKSAILNTTVTYQRSPNKQVTRNHSYVISKSPRDNYNNEGRGGDLNSTFTCANEDSASPTDSNSGSAHNLSMEELHVMARLQEQSLKNASPQRTIVRKDTQTIMTFQNLDVKRPTRTSSTDTYCVGQSNPDSPGSSGLSSPMDAHSYDNLQGDAFRRSMPDLAITRRLSSGSVSRGTLSLVPQRNTLKSKPYHTSDTRLSHSGNSRLSTLQPASARTLSYNRNMRNPSPDLMSSNSSIETNMQMRPHTGRASVGRTLVGVDTRTVQRPYTGLSQPRFSTRSALRPPSAQSMLPTPGFSQIGGGIRPQSRIPAPGSARPRLSRPLTGRSTTSGAKPPDWKEGCY